MLLPLYQHHRDSARFACHYTVGSNNSPHCGRKLVFAWKKPLNAQRPILIKPNPNVPPSSLARPDISDITVTRAFETEQKMFQCIERQYQFECPQPQSIFLLKSIFRLRLTRRTFVSILLWPIRSICEDLFWFEPSLAGVSHEFPEGTLKIPLFHVPVITIHVLFPLLASALGMGVSIVLLRSGSTLLFPSEGAKLVWRIASITSTSFSAATLGLAVLANAIGFLDDRPFCASIIYRNLRVLAIAFVLILFGILRIGVFLFFLARVVLLVSSVLCLRSVPGDVFVSQSWVDYIPHFSCA